MSPSPPRVLIIASEPVVRPSPGESPAEPHLDPVAVSEPEHAKRLLEQERFDVLVVDLSRRGTSRLDLVRHVRESYPDCKIVLVSSVSYHQEIAEGFALGASDYLQRPVARADLLRSVSRAMTADVPRVGPGFWEGLELQLQSERKRAALEGIQALVCAVEARDPYTQRHSRQVGRYVSQLARRLDLAAELVESASVAALVHDVGKVSIPDSILTAPGELTFTQFECVRRHPGLGEYIIRNLSVFDAEARIVRHHHENWDGSGYPDGLRGPEIPLGSQIIRVADAMDAMLMQRSYKTAYPVDNMLDELRRGAGREFDSKLAAVAVEWCRRHPQELILAAARAEPAPAGSA